MQKIIEAKHQVNKSKQYAENDCCIFHNMEYKYDATIINGQLVQTIFE